MSADGPESPERVQLNKALIGFLTHSGYAHGGNGYEGIAFLLEQFRDTGLKDPTDPGPRDRPQGAGDAIRASEYARYKSQKKTAGSLDIAEDPRRQPPGVQGQAGQPRSARGVRARTVREARREQRVPRVSTTRWCKALFDAGVSRNVYCVNIDAVIAALLLKMLWEPYRKRHIPGASAGNGGVHDLPLSAHAGLCRRDRRPPEPRPQHGYAHAGIANSVRGVKARRHQVQGPLPRTGRFAPGKSVGTNS